MRCLEEAFEDDREEHRSPGTGNKIKEIMTGRLVSQRGLIGYREVRCSHPGLSAVGGGAGHMTGNSGPRWETFAYTQPEL